MVKIVLTNDVSDPFIMRSPVMHSRSAVLPDLEWVRLANPGDDLAHSRSP